MSSLKPSPIHCLLLPGLHGTDELFTSLKSALDESEVKLEFQTFNYPTSIPQKYAPLVEWVKSELTSGNTPKDFIIIAESFSSPIALILAHEFPDRVKAVIIAAGFCSSPMSINFALLPLRPLFMLSPPRAAVRHFLLDDSASIQEVDELRELLKSIPAQILSQRLRSVLTLEETQLPSIPKTPVLLLQAQDDILIPWEIQSQLEAHLPHSETHWISSPHLILQSRPKRSAKYIVEFLQKIV